jgi:hypothetical protein
VILLSRKGARDVKLVMPDTKLQPTKLQLYGHLLQETLAGAAQKTEDFVFKPSCPAPAPTKKEGVTESTATPQFNYGSGG